jgi:hypothetical protein
MFRKILASEKNAEVRREVLCNIYRSCAAIKLKLRGFSPRANCTLVDEASANFCG